MQAILALIILIFHHGNIPPWEYQNDGFLPSFTEQFDKSAFELEIKTRKKIPMLH